MRRYIVTVPATLTALSPHLCRLRLYIGVIMPVSWRSGSGTDTTRLEYWLEWLQPAMSGELMPEGLGEFLTRVNTVLGVYPRSTFLTVDVARDLLKRVQVGSKSDTGT